MGRKWGWAALLVWYLAPLVGRALGVLLVPDGAVLLWVFLGLLVAMAYLNWTAFHLSEHVKYHYPEKYREIYSHKDRFRLSRSHRINRAFDWWMTFSPPSDSRYTALASAYQNASLLFCVALMVSVSAFCFYNM